MTNDEAQMTKEARNPKSEIERFGYHPNLGLRISDFFRHSCFVIRHFVCCVFLASVWPVEAADSGSSVIVIYNSRKAESKRVAEYYAQKRQVPAEHVFWFALPTEETVSRA